jgi:UDP-glucose 4-epimerase
VSLRYFTVYGERERPDMAIHKFIDSILEGEEILIYGNGGQKRDFTYVSDAVNATILAMKANSGEVFNVAGGSAISVNDLIRILEELTGKKARIKYVEKQKGDVQDTVADISKARKMIGYEPRIDIKEGLRRQVNYQKL